MPSSPSGTRLWLVLSRTAHTLEGVARRDLESQGLCLTDFAVLEILLHKGPLPVNTIGRGVLLTSGSITAAIDRLSARGLVRRDPHPSDRRARLVSLTPSGTTLVTQAFAAHSDALERAVSSLSEQERRSLVRLLLKLERSAAQHDPPTVPLPDAGGTS